MAKEKPRKLSKTEELIQAAESVTALWMEYRKCFRKAFTNQEIEQDEEQHFLKVKSDLSRLYRTLTQRLPEGFRWGGKRMTELMGQSVSIAALRDLPLPDKKGLYNQWHESYIAMQNLRGILDIMHEGYPVKIEAAHAKSSNLKEAIGLTGQGRKKKNVTGVVVKAAVAIAIVGAAAWYLLTQM